MSDTRIPRIKDDIRKVLWYLKPISPFPEDNSSIGRIATSVLANKNEIMEGKEVFK